MGNLALRSAKSVDQPVAHSSGLASSQRTLPGLLSRRRTASTGRALGRYWFENQHFTTPTNLVDIKNVAEPRAAAEPLAAAPEIEFVTRRRPEAVLSPDRRTCPRWSGYAPGSAACSVWIERVTNREEPCQFRWAVQYPAQRAPPE